MGWAGAGRHSPPWHAWRHAGLPPHKSNAPRLASPGCRTLQTPVGTARVTEVNHACRLNAAGTNLADVQKCLGAGLGECVGATYEGWLNVPSTGTYE